MLCKIKVSEQWVEGDEEDEDKVKTMKASTVTLTWIVLVCATVLSWWLSGGNATAQQIAGQAGEHLAIIALAIFKMYLVAAIFMGLWGAPSFWHLYAIALLLLIGGLMVALVVTL